MDELNKFIVRKRGYRGEYHTPDKKEADQLLEPGTVVDCIENGIHTKSYGCVSSKVTDKLLISNSRKALINKQG